MYNFRIVDLSKKLIGTLIYFLCMFVLWNMAEMISVNISFIFQITVYKYDIVKLTLFEALSTPLLCGYVIFLISDKAKIKTIFFCYVSKQNFLGALFIFIILVFPCVVLKFLSTMIMNELLKSMIIMLVMIIGLQTNYQIIDFARNRRCRIKLFFDSINYKKYLITLLILTPIYVIYAFVRNSVNFDIYEAGIITDFFFTQMLCGANLITLPIYYIYFNNNVYKDQ